MDKTDLYYKLLSQQKNVCQTVLCHTAEKIMYIPS